MENIKIIYEDENVLAVDKPAGLNVYSEDKAEETLINLLIKQYPGLKRVGKSPRYGIVHRLDKDTSGVLLIAKNEKALFFLQKQFKQRKVEKKYIALVVGNLKTEKGKIETLIGRAPKNKLKQKVYLSAGPNSEGKRKAVTEYKVIKRFKDYALVEVIPKTGRQHQIRCHFAYLGHPVVKDKLYGFKNQPCPDKELNRHFLHAEYIKIHLPTGVIKEIKSELPKDLKEIIKKLKINH